MNTKTISVTERHQLCKTFTKEKVSPATVWKMLQIMGELQNRNCQNLEMMARKLREIVETSKTEEEMIERAEKLIP